MEHHTMKAVGTTFALFLLVPPLGLGLVAISGPPGGMSGKILGAATYIASAWIFWSWLTADSRINPAPRSAKVIAVAAYVVFSVLAVAGYLIYSRGALRGFGATMWFALFVAGVIASMMVEMEVLNAFFRAIGPH